MKQTRIPLITLLIQAARPWSILAGILLYVMGSGIVIYLGGIINWTVFWLGLACITLLQISSYLLKTYYDLVEAGDRPSRQPRDPNADPPPALTRSILLQVAFTTLTVGAVTTVLLIMQGAVSLTGWLLLGISFFLAFFYAVPPLRLAYSGYGELVQSILVANLVPSLAYAFQTGELHRLLGMLTFVLTALYLSSALALSLPKYLNDLSSGHRTMMVRLGWQRGMNFHNILILSAYAILGLAATLGLPWVLTRPVLLTLPLGLFQIWQIVQIYGGARPRWRLLTLAARALPGLAAYLIALALWTG
jgi:1,4-dihydroxy-2-naphthoate polyprenyltransferase